MIINAFSIVVIPKIKTSANVLTIIVLVLIHVHNIIKTAQVYIVLEVVPDLKPTASVIHINLIKSNVLNVNPKVVPKIAVNSVQNSRPTLKASVFLRIRRM